jgi:hypothetical protein
MDDLHGRLGTQWGRDELGWWAVVPKALMERA